MLELSIVLLVVGLVSAMGASMMQGTFESVHWGTTNMELNTIEDALMAYRTAYNRLPCPADPALLPTDANYGVEAASVTGGCTGGTPAAPFVDSVHSVVEGAVPFKTLGIPESFMYDGWNRKFAYAVNQNVTAINAMQSEMLSDQCGISVSDASGVAGNRTTGAIYALVSFGPDGHGGYLKNGSRMDAGVTNADEETNCHCDANANATTYAASYVEKDTSLDASDASHPFQDLVRFKERWQMMTTDDRYMTSGGPVCSYGFRVDGSVTNGYVGLVQIATGDINGDGIKDLVIGAQGASGQGYVYVVFGTKYGFPNPLPLNSLNGSNGFSLYLSWSMGSVAVGDFDHDGYKDILIGSEVTPAGVFYGGSGPFNASYNMSSLSSACQGFLIRPSGGGVDLYSVAAGDLNGDGIDDMVISQQSATSGNAHVVYVIFGRAKTCPGTPTFANNLDPTTLNASTTPRGSTIVGDDFDFGYQSYGLAIGDINHDGYNDLAIGDPSANSDHGRVYVVFGQASWPSTITADSLAGSGSSPYGFVIDDSTVNAFLGYHLAFGDVTGDGIADLLIGGPWEQYDFVVPGHANPWSANYEINTMVSGGSAYEFHYNGGQALGTVMTVGDINGDGVNDLIIGNAFGGAYGSVFVLYGPITASRDLYSTPLTGTDGFRIDCSYANSSTCGNSLAVGDVNGDGLSDLAIGVPYGNVTGSNQEGYVYVLYGSSLAGHFPSVLPLDRIK